MKGGDRNMTLIKYDPFRSIFDYDLSKISNQNGLKIKETEKDILIEAVVAGIPPEHVDINIEDGVLTIKAETNEEESNKNEYKSSSYQYYYTTALSGGQWDKTEAEINHGIVTITIPKAESAKPRKIAVKAKGK